MLLTKSTPPRVERGASSHLAGRDSARQLRPVSRLLLLTAHCHARMAFRHATRLLGRSHKQTTDERERPTGENKESCRSFSPTFFVGRYVVRLASGNSTCSPNVSTCMFTAPTMSRCPENPHSGHIHRLPFGRWRQPHLGHRESRSILERSDGSIPEAKRRGQGAGIPLTPGEASRSIP